MSCVPFSSPDVSTNTGLQSDDRTLNIKYKDISSALNYKLGLVIMDVCYGATARPYLAAAPAIFKGQPGTLIPRVNSINTWEVITPGQQGTNKFNILSVIGPR